MKGKFQNLIAWRLPVHLLKHYSHAHPVAHWTDCSIVASENILHEFVCSKNFWKCGNCTLIQLTGGANSSSRIMPQILLSPCGTACCSWMETSLLQVLQHNTPDSRNDILRMLDSLVKVYENSDYMVTIVITVVHWPNHIPKHTLMVELWTLFFQLAAIASVTVIVQV